MKLKGKEMEDLLRLFASYMLLYFYSLAFVGVFTGRKPDELDINWKGGFIVILVGAVIVNGLYSKIVICK
jgi:hypothetical protein